MHKGTYKGTIEGLTKGTYRGNVKGLVKGLFQNDKRRKNRKPLLIIIAGQSNAEKGALFANVDLTVPYLGPFPEVQYWKAGAGNTGFVTLGSSDDDFYQAPVDGTLQYANQFYLYPRVAFLLGCSASKPLYVCSNSIGDTDLASDWSSTIPGNQYTDLVTRVKACKTHIRNFHGVNPTVLFCLFDQGEKDGRDATKTSNYQTNQTNFINNLRTAISEPNLKFILPLLKLGSINGSPNPVQLGGTINLAKKAVAAADPTRIITQDTNYCEPSTDGVHFTAAGQIVKNIGTGGSVGAKRFSQTQCFIDAGWISGAKSPPVPTNETYFDGCTNFVRFGDILDSLFAAVDAVFRIGITIWNPPPFTSRCLFGKIATTGNQRSFLFTLNTTILTFNYYRTGISTQVRAISWSGLSILYDGNEHSIEIRYNGAVDTNDGLDRPDLYIDGVLYTTGKTLAASVGTLGDIFSSSAQLAVGALVANGGLKDSTAFVMGGWAREFFVQDGSAVDVIRVANLATGTDSSGNGNNGTYV